VLFDYFKAANITVQTTDSEGKKSAMKELPSDKRADVKMTELDDDDEDEDDDSFNDESGS